MIDRFVKTVPYKVEVVNLREFNFFGGCIGCFNCAASGVCIYKDGFDVLLRDRIQKSDATVYAFKIKDHSMGYRFKLYDDRQFCNGHRTVTMGKPVGYLIDGHLQAENNLKTLIEGRSQVGGNPLAGVATNELDVDAQIDMLCKELDYILVHKYKQPANFYGVSGMKIFRDLIYKMQGLMREDHRFYKEHGFYDFPQKDKGMIAGMYLVGAMMKSSFFKKKAGKMTEGMLLPYKKIIDNEVRFRKEADAPADAHQAADRRLRLAACVDKDRAGMPKRGRRMSSLRSGIHGAFCTFLKLRLLQNEPPSSCRGT